MSSSNQTHGLRALRVRRLAAMCVATPPSPLPPLLTRVLAAASATSGTKPLPSAPLANPTTTKGLAPSTRICGSYPTSSQRTAPAPFPPPTSLPRYLHTTSKSKSGTPTTCGAVVQSTAGVPRVNSFTGTPIFLSHAANWQSASPTYAYKPPAPAFADVVAPVPDAASATANITPSARPADFVGLRISSNKSS
ncbi:hypothetical protein C8R44DRAFT_733185 [Mycena epipterygia]|nr:hypothetical protein C8R44DRAFT_733185 [Mycena epipterygia]